MKLEVRHLFKSYNGHRNRERLAVLKDVNFTVDKGQFVSIVGPSGCGKTTLLEIIAGLQEASSGSIQIDRVPLSRSSANRSIVFQQYALFPWLSVRKNIEFGPKINGMKTRQRRVLAEKFIEMVGLKGFEKYYPHELSGGMQQRVALARALANEPDILLLDEPFAALDAQTRETCQRELLALWKQTRLTVLFITHDVGEAIFLSDRVFVLSSAPAWLKDNIAIDLKRPRELETRMTEDFRKMEFSIRAKLNPEMP
jgi:ABC-type nitrate/sulfonate/bicarbonate transport system ATPase subunit